MSETASACNMFELFDDDNEDNVLWVGKFD